MNTATTVQLKRPTPSSATAGSAARMERAKALCQCAEHTLESAWLGASKGEIEWALTKAETAVKTLKSAKKLMPPNSDYPAAD